MATSALARKRAGYVTFSEWIGERHVAHYSTNTGAEPVAFQTWRHFKEAFAPELIGQAYEETSEAIGRRVASCIDPFGGSGTTALACQFLGVEPVTIEVNPYLADLIDAKLGIYDTDKLISDFQRVVDRRGRVSSLPPLSHAPKTFVEPGVQGRFIFFRSVAKRLEEISKRIARLDIEENRRLLRVLLASIAVECSNVVVSGKGRRYRKGWQNRKLNDVVVDELFAEAFMRAVYEIQRYRRRLTVKGTVIRGDAREAIPTRRRFDMAVFSPPYPNSFDYTDVYNVELWVCGYLLNAQQNRQLRERTLRSHVQIKRSYDAGEVDSQILERVYSELSDVRRDLWDKSIPEMVYAYFDDMQQVLRKLSQCLRDCGRVYIVVGDSRYNSVTVPVSEILEELSHSVDMELVSNEPFRSMRASPQQGGRPALLETLLTFQRLPRS